MTSREMAKLLEGIDKLAYAAGFTEGVEKAIEEIKKMQLPYTTSASRLWILKALKALEALKPKQ